MFTVVERRSGSPSSAAHYVERSYTTRDEAEHRVVKLEEELSAQGYAMDGWGRWQDEEDGPRISFSIEEDGFDADAEWKEWRS